MSDLNNITVQVQQNVLAPAATSFNKYIAPVVTQPYVKLIILYITIVSIILSINQLPMKIKQILNSPLSKLLVTFLSVFVLTEKLNIAVIFSLIVAVIYFISKSYGKEMFDLISPTPDTYPGCVNVTVTDLLALYKGDRNALKQAMYESGVPLDLELNDTNAPLIASYFIGTKDVTASCSMNANADQIS